MFDEEPTANRLATEATFAPTPPRRFTLSALIVVAVVVGLGAWWTVGDRLLPNADNTLAIFPFAINGSESDAQLATNIVDLLTRDIGTTELRAVDPAIVLQASASHDPADQTEARAIARTIGAGQFVLGTVSDYGGTIRIDAQLYTLRNSAQVLAETRVEGDAAHLPEMVHQLTAGLIAGRNQGTAGTRRR